MGWAIKNNSAGSWGRVISMAWAGSATLAADHGEDWVNEALKARLILQAVFPASLKPRPHPGSRNLPGTGHSPVIHRPLPPVLTELEPSPLPTHLGWGY